MGDVSVEWSGVQSGIQQFTRVCSYDRAGYGNSDAGPMPRTSARIADELFTLLRAADEKPPFVLVGHSFGGYNVRVFHGAHPELVAGMVLIDSVQEDEYRLLPPAWDRLSKGLLRHYQSQARWAPLTINFGITRLQLGAQADEPFFYLYLQPKYLKARASELENIRASAEQARASGNLGNHPLIVLTAGKQAEALLTGVLTQADLDQYRRAWIHDIQPRLLQLSTDSKQILLQDSGHNVPAERPDAIISAVREVCDQARQP